MALGTSTLGPFCAGAGFCAAGRSAPPAGCAEAEELAVAVAEPDALLEADGDEDCCGPELIVRFTLVPGSTGVPASMPDEMTLPAATLSLGNEVS